MESYEDFRGRIVSEMRQRSCSTAPGRAEAPLHRSLIRFHGRAALSPLLHEHQSAEMVKHKREAVKLEAKYNLLTQKANTADASGRHNTPSPNAGGRGFTSPDTAPQPFVWPVEPPSEGGAYLHNLLKRSREFVQREQGRQGSKVVFSAGHPTVVDLSEDTPPAASPFYVPCQSSSPHPAHPDPSLSPGPRRERPRPISAGSIFFTYPEDAITPSADPYTPSREAELTSPVFRRRSHTLEPPPQERMPRFMAGVTARATPASPTQTPRPLHHTTPCEDDAGPVSAAERFPLLSPGDRSPRCHLKTSGFPVNSSAAPSPSTHTPLLLRRSRVSQVLWAEQQVALCRLTAIARGVLTRRLLNTEKVRHLRQTVQDTQQFIASFSSGASLSEQDRALQERVRAQLRAATLDLHEIFFTTPPEERLLLLRQERELRTERKLREMKARSPKEKVILSAATQKSLERKKRVGESPGQTRRAQKPRSPPAQSVRQPGPAHHGPASSHTPLPRGSQKTTPEERYGLKKQHSLG